MSARSLLVTFRHISPGVIFVDILLLRSHVNQCHDLNISFWSIGIHSTFRILIPWLGLSAYIMIVSIIRADAKSPLKSVASQPIVRWSPEKPRKKTKKTTTHEPMSNCPLRCSTNVGLTRSKVFSQPVWPAIGSSWHYRNWSGNIFTLGLRKKVDSPEEPFSDSFSLRRPGIGARVIAIFFLCAKFLQTIAARLTEKPLMDIQTFPWAEKA